jgi:Tat protein secretion system quality control protein TatD with DNase activity
VAEKIAEVKGISVDEVKQITTATAKKIFEC